MENPIITVQSITTLLQRKMKQIIWSAIACGVLAAIISLVIPEVWEAQSILVIMPPKFQTDIQQTNFSPITYQNLLESKELAKQIIERLSKKEASLKKLKVETLQKSMKTKVVIEEKGLNEKSYSPMVKLIVQAETPKLAAEIANTWAEIFVEQNGKLTNNATELSYDFMTGQFSLTTTELFAAEEDLRMYKDNTKLDLLKSQIASEITKLESYRANLTDMKYEYDTKSKRLERLQKILDAQEIDGNWIGNIRANMSYADFLQEKKSFENKSIDLAFNEIRRQVLNAKGALILGQEQMNNFLETHKIEMMHTQFALQNAELVDTRVELTKDLVRMQSLDSSVQAIRDAIQLQDKYIILKKSITDEALWNNLINSTSTTRLDPNKLAQLKLETEEINPIYLGLVKQLVDQEVELNTIRPKLKSQQEKIINLDTVVRILDTQYHDNLNQRDRLMNQYSMASVGYDFVAGKYNQTKSDYIALDLEVDQIKAKLAQTMSQVSDLDNKSKLIQSLIYEGEITQQQKVRVVTTISTTYDMISREVEKARLAKSNEISDLKIASRAVEPQQRIWPRRSIITGLAFMAGLLLSFLVFLVQDLFFPPRRESA